MHDMQKYRLKIAAGYKASMDIYGSKLLLCTEIAHKLINLHTVWDEMERIFNESGYERSKPICLEKFVGLTVMTK